jgi:hypothetical protein
VTEFLIPVREISDNVSETLDIGTPFKIQVTEFLLPVTETFDNGTETHNIVYATNCMLEQIAKRSDTRAISHSGNVLLKMQAPIWGSFVALRISQGGLFSPGQG